MLVLKKVYFGIIPSTWVESDLRGCYQWQIEKLFNSKMIILQLLPLNSIFPMIH